MRSLEENEMMNVNFKHDDTLAHTLVVFVALVQAVSHVTELFQRDLDPSSYLIFHQLAFGSRVQQKKLHIKDHTQKFENRKAQYRGSMLELQSDEIKINCGNYTLNVPHIYVQNQKY